MPLICSSHVKDAWTQVLRAIPKQKRHLLMHEINVISSELKFENAEIISLQDLRGSHWARRRGSPNAVRVSIRGEGSYFTSFDDVEREFKISHKLLHDKLSRGGGKCELKRGDRIITILK